MTLYERFIISLKEIWLLPQCIHWWYCCHWYNAKFLIGITALSFTMTIYSSSPLSLSQFQQMDCSTRSLTQIDLKHMHIRNLEPSIKHVMCHYFLPSDKDYTCRKLTAVSKGFCNFSHLKWQFGGVLYNLRMNSRLIYSIARDACPHSYLSQKYLSTRTM